MDTNPGTCQWYEPSIIRGEEVYCDQAADRSVGVTLTLGMNAKVRLCRRHAAEFNRVQAGLRLKRGSK